MASKCQLFKAADHSLFGFAIQKKMSNIQRYSIGRLKRRLYGDKQSPKYHLQKAISSEFVFYLATHFSKGSRRFLDCFFLDCFRPPLARYFLPIRSMCGVQILDQENNGSNQIIVYVQPNYRLCTENI